MIEKLIQKSKNITAAGRSDIKPAWIAQAQRRLGFALPASYKQILLRYASGAKNTIAPPEFADSADADICYTYEINLKNGLFAADELVFLQLEDEEYYFKISPASAIADGSPNTARGKTAGSTSGKAMGATARDTVVATVADGAENRASDDEARAERSPDAACDINAETTCKAASATTSEATSGATKEIASERVDDAPCEYKVYVRDYAQSEDRLFADDFYGFLEKF